MNNNKLRPFNKNLLYELIQTSKGEKKSDTYIKGGTIINIYTGEYIKANVALKGKHIAYIGDSEVMVGEETNIVNAEGFYLCPGYIEPHAHPFQTYNPITLIEKVMTSGTTTLICDNLFFYMNIDIDLLLELLVALSRLPIKLLWSVRLDPQTHSPEREARFAPEKIEKLLEKTIARQVGELTDWPALIHGKEQMLENILLAFKLGKRIEGHAPGASQKTLNILAAGGISACHESITCEEALNRLRLGMYATLRHSSLRPDLPGIIKDFVSSGVDLHRAMITTDGMTPPSLKHGFTDYILRLSMQAGLSSIEAYRMATLNPATYYGMDHELGGIAPGRLADILFLEHPGNPTPIKVFAEGNLVAENGAPLVKFPEPLWADFGIQPIETKAPEIKLEHLIPLTNGTNTFPVMKLVNPVITRRIDKSLPVRSGYFDITADTGLVYAALLNKEGSWVCNGILQGFAETLEGMACSNTITGDIIILGRNPNAMLQATRRMYEIGGGVVIAENDRIIYELPLNLSGIMSDQPVDNLVESCSRLYELLAERGHPHYDLLYTILFLSATHLPELRLSPGGILSVKDKKILVPIRKI